jgi:hypothetical protein
MVVEVGGGELSADHSQVHARCHRTSLDINRDHIRVQIDEPILADESYSNG